MIVSARAPRPTRDSLDSLDAPRPLSRGHRLAWVVGLGADAVVVAVAVLYSRTELHPLPSLILGHSSAVAVVSGVTSLLMFSQAAATRRRGYLVLGSTYLYVAGVTALFPFLYPGAVAEGRIVLGGPDSAPALYFMWHWILAIGITLGAAVLRLDEDGTRSTVRRWSIPVSVAITLAVTAGSWALVVAGHGVLPRMIDTSVDPWVLITPLPIGLGYGLLILLGLATTAVAARNGSVICRWLFAVMVLLAGEAVVMAASPTRFTFGWYFNRLFGLTAYLVMLVVLALHIARAGRTTWRLAARDSLTGAESRDHFLADLPRELERAAARGRSTALLWIDLDGFKSINDQLGHPVGNEALKEVAARLRSEIRGGDRLARLGGDEFGVLLCDDVSEERIGAAAERILALLREPLVLYDSPTLLSGSIGVALAPQDAEEPDDLLLRADLAMYAAKRSGGDRHVRYDASLGSEARVKAQFRHDLSQAIRAHDFTLRYQPIVDPGSGAPRGVEALVRWANGTAVDAASFIPFAEESGQIIGIGREVLRLLADDIDVLMEGAPEAFILTVNLSVAELGDNAIVAQLLEGPLAAHSASIVVEVTESLELHSDGDAVVNLERLRAGGVGIAVDDFGAGFSNVSRLESIRPRLIKIDRALVANAGLGVGGSVGFLEAATAIGRALGCDMVAEGVETDAEAEVVAALGIDFAQGFRYCPPLPLGELREWLAGHAVVQPHQPRRVQVEPGL